MPDLSENAKKLLRHFRDGGFKQRAFEYPAKMETLFTDAEGCEAAQDELVRLGILELVPEVSTHMPVKNKIRAAALTLDGERFLQENDLG
jgi:hypothetical protein